MARPDHVVFIVFPHVTIEVPSVGQVPEIGHAGVLLIKGGSGLTKYYEYGRYDPAALGIVRNKSVPNVVMQADGAPTTASLKHTFRVISEQSGKRTMVSSVIYRTEDQFDHGLALCAAALAQNSNPARPPYSVLTNNCVFFADRIVNAMGAFTAFIVNPIPHVYILALQAASTAIPGAHWYDYDYATDTLT